jgi:L-ribulose-5-phosphate 3-epimerase
LNYAKFGIMQGRLIDPPTGDDLDWFPFDEWQDEFQLAESLKLGNIELVADREMKSNNPLMSAEGIKKLKSLFDKHRLQPLACCSNFIIDKPLENQLVMDNVYRVIDGIGEIGCRYIILPLFGHSEISEDRKAGNIINAISAICKFAERHKISVLIESNLSGKEIMRFFSRLNESNVGLVYDIGNATARGHNINDDLDRMALNIKHVHLKDKNLKDQNVLLGTGLVDFVNFFKQLDVIEYNGLYTLETCRGSKAMTSVNKNINYLKEVFIA